MTFIAAFVAAFIIGFIAQQWKGRTGAFWGAVVFFLSFPMSCINGIGWDNTGLPPYTSLLGGWLCAGISAFVVALLVFIALATTPNLKKIKNQQGSLPSQNSDEVK